MCQELYWSRLTRQRPLYIFRQIHAGLSNLLVFIFFFFWLFPHSVVVVCVCVCVYRNGGLTYREMIDVPPIPYWFAPSQKPNLIFLFLLFSQQLIIQIFFCQSNDNNKGSDSNIYFVFPFYFRLCYINAVYWSTSFLLASSFSSSSYYYD